MKNPNVSKQQKKTTIRKKITLGMAMIIVLSLVIAAAIQTKLNIDETTDQIHTSVDMMSQYNAKVVQSVVRTNVAKMNAASVALSELDNKLSKEFEDEVSAIADNMIGIDGVFSVYVALEKNVIMDCTHGKSYYYFSDGNGGIEEYIAEDYDVYSIADYYVPAKENGIIHVTEPYDWTLDNGNVVSLITIALPLYNEQGKFIGVINCDFEIATLAGLDYNASGYKSLNTIVLTNGGYYVANLKNPSAVGHLLDSSNGTESYKQALNYDETGIFDTKNFSDKNAGATAIAVPITLRGTDLDWSMLSVLSSDEMMENVVSTTLINAIIYFLCVTLLIVFGFVFIGKTLKPFEEVMTMANRLGELNFEPYQMQMPTSNDELGELCEVFTESSKKLNLVVNDCSNLLSLMANSNFDINLENADAYIGDMKRILEALQEINYKVSVTYVLADAAANQVSNGALQVDSASQSLSQSSTEQAASVEELAATITEISRNVEQNNENAQRGQEEANQSMQLIDTSAAQMSQLQSAMNEVTENSKKIEKIIKAIDDIAFQTNILALNAAVEAARAGEAGKGFAVVADEVRNLSQKSADAAKNTQLLIEQVVASIDNSSTLVESAAEGMAQAVDGAKENYEMMNKIAIASQEQANAIAQVTVGIDQISSAIQMNSATSEETAAASAELTNNAESLSNNLKAVIPNSEVKRRAEAGEDLSI